MTTKIVYQIDTSGLYVGPTTADESPMEPGVWLMPARTVEAAPPEEFGAGQWPRWNGRAWVLANNYQAEVAATPLEKLQAFLSANPDVAALLNT